MNINIHLITTVLKELQLDSNDCVIDFFCGIGNFSIPIAKQAKKVLGFEYDSNMLELAEENAGENLCKNISFLSDDVPKIRDNFKQIFSPQTAYQITSILEGATKRGTAKKLKDLNLDIAGKTGTTNKNTDTWFIGFTSDLVVGVYVGYDEPRTLGKFETGAKTAMPIFKSFIKKAVKKEIPRPFKIPENITLMVVDSQTGKKVSFGSKKTLIESFKTEKINQNFDISSKNNNRFNNNNILKFY